MSKLKQTDKSSKFDSVPLQVKFARVVQYTYNGVPSLSLKNHFIRAYSQGSEGIGLLMNNIPNNN